MRLVIMLVGLILICSWASALNFDEKITIKGDGKMYAQTTTEQSSDLAEGYGPQSYHRNLNLLVDKVAETDISSLTSQYELQSNSSIANYAYLTNQKKIELGNDIYKNGSHIYAPIREPIYPNYTPNRYQIRMKSPNGLQQEISIRGRSGNGTSNLSSDSSIIFTPIGQQTSTSKNPSYGVTTSFNVNGDGDLTETVSKASVKHPANLAETSISGNFNVLSRLADDDHTSLNNQLVKLDDVQTAADLPSDAPSLEAADHLESELMDGSITQSTYLEDMKNLLQKENMNITPEVYAEKLKSAYDRGLVTVDYAEYKAALQIAAPKMLSELTGELQDKTINSDDYLASLNKMLDDDLLSENDYLTYLKNVNDSFKRDINKNESMVRVRNRYVNGSLTKDYIVLLSNMKDSGLITNSEYTSQISLYSSAKIAQFAGMMADGTIDEVDFLRALLEMRDDDYIDENQYNQSKQEVLDQLIQKYAQNVSEKEKYESILGDLLRYGAIDLAEYNKMIPPANG